MTSATNIKKRSCKKGSVLLEITAAVMVMVVIGAISFQSMMNTLATRNWTITKTLVDAYLSVEVADANAIPFELITTDNSDTTWPTYVAYSEGGSAPAATTTVIGKRSASTNANGVLEDGFDVTADVRRVYINPAGTDESLSDIITIRIIVAYETNGREYIASRTVVRSQ
ncbi:hypothetical protein [Persicirhabdus sediminis]|uniref:Uncharacterized protein n=1 Tax=Persicirhabdus sediminis TaxID=454144 RepID=A0A8J7MF51_9BACT|nr:hypothetical protein [Persicirhabdus sediminis]MBK1791570.1 hypothetical protein [Persicirhabdus sediminis]